MNINIIIDKDSFGILTDMLSDDLAFLLFLKKNNIKPKDKEINWETLEWREISNHDNLPFEFIDEFQNYLDWYTLTRIHKDDMDFIRSFSENVEWSIISSRMIFTDIYNYDFFEEFHEKFDWTKISRWSMIAEDFIDRFVDRLDWNILSGCQGLTRYLVAKYHDRIVWDRTRNNRSFDRELIEEFEPINDNEDIDLELNNEEQSFIGPQQNTEQIEENIINNMFNNNNNDSSPTNYLL